MESPKRGDRIRIVSMNPTNHKDPRDLASMSGRTGTVMIAGLRSGKRHPDDTYMFVQMDEEIPASLVVLKDSRLIRYLEIHPSECQPENAPYTPSGRDWLLESMRNALADLIYETTHLSPQEADGSHRCRIHAGPLERARAALRACDDMTKKRA